MTATSSPAEPPESTESTLATDAQAAYDRGHPAIAGHPLCLHDPCPWHPARETRLRGPVFGPAVLVAGEPSLVVIDVAAALRPTQDRA